MSPPESTTRSDAPLSPPTRVQASPGNTPGSGRVGSRGLSRALRESRILQVAGKVFAASSYERASMDRIAELAGVSKPVLYAYFGSKEGLYVAYIERTGSELVGRLVRADAGSHGPDRLRAVIAEFLGFVEEHRDGWRVLFRELTAQRPVAEEAGELRWRLISEVGRMLEGDGSLRAPASEGVAEAIVGAGEALANWWLRNPDVALEEVAEWYEDLTRGAIGAAAHQEA